MGQKKKWSDHPIPSVNMKVARRPENPEVLVKRRHTDIPVSIYFLRIPFLKKFHSIYWVVGYSTCKTSHSTCKTSVEVQTGVQIFKKIKHSHSTCKTTGGRFKLLVLLDLHILSSIFLTILTGLIYISVVRNPTI